jgi:hypothetical protein
MGFTKAQRTQSQLRIALSGPAGSGKTWTALELATGLAEKIGSRIALLDTENGSSNLYASSFDFDSMDLRDQSVEGYLRAMGEAMAAGYKVLILDSISPEWDSILRVVDNAGGGKFGAWKDATPLHDRFIDAIKTYPGHIFATIRAKTAYEIEQAEGSGKKTIRKIGLAPKQRDGIEYEFDAFLDLDISNRCNSTKDRLHLFAEPRILSRQDGGMLGEWVLGIETEIEARERKLEEAIDNACERARVLKSKEEFSRLKSELLAAWGFDARDKDGKPARFLPAKMAEAMGAEWANFEARGHKPAAGEGE